MFVLGVEGGGRWDGGGGGGGCGGVGGGDGDGDDDAVGGMFVLTGLSSKTEAAPLGFLYSSLRSLSACSVMMRMYFL